MYSVRVRKRQPVASWTSSTVRSLHSSRSSSSSLRTTSGASSPSNIWRSSDTERGCWAASRAASRMRLISAGLDGNWGIALSFFRRNFDYLPRLFLGQGRFRVVGNGQAHVDGHEGLGLGDADQPLPGQL